MTNAKKPTLQELLERPYSVEICHCEPGFEGKGYFIAFMPEFGQQVCSATADTREGAMRKLMRDVRPVVFKHALEKGYAFPEPISFVSAPPRGPSTPPASSWQPPSIGSRITFDGRSGIVTHASASTGQGTAQLDNGESVHLGEAGEREGRWRREPPRAPWPTRMLVEEIATRIRTAMEDKDMSIFDLSVKLNWAPERLLQWLDGTLADLDMEDENGSLRELVQIGEALEMRWKWRIGKATNVR